MVRRKRKEKNKKNKKIDERDNKIVVGTTNGNVGAQFDYSEIYRQLRTNVEFPSYEKDLNVISVTSTKPSEGKSSVASNLALIYATKYEKVLLIDCDLRKPVQHKIFKTSNAYGISNLTKQIATFDVNDDHNYQRFKEPNMEGKLFMIPAGSKVPNPQELLSSEKFEQLIKILRTRFDYIIIDCPPIYAVSDAVPVAGLSDGTIFVCSAKDTDKNEAKSALEQIQRNGANIIGCVLTKVEDKGSYSYSYGYY